MKRFFKLDKLEKFVRSFAGKGIAAQISTLREMLADYEKQKNIYTQQDEEESGAREGMTAKKLTIGFEDLKTCSETLQKTLSEVSYVKEIRELIEQYSGDKKNPNYINAKENFQLLQEAESKLAEAKSLENDPVLLKIKSRYERPMSLASACSDF